MIAIFLATSAYGGQLVVSAGYEQAVDAFVYPRGGSVAIGWAFGVRGDPLAPVAEVTVGAAWYPFIVDDPDRMTPDWTPAYEAIDAVTYEGYYPSWTLGHADLTLRLHLLRVPLSTGWAGSIGLSSGAGVVVSQDLIGRFGPDAPRTQLSLAAGAGVFIQARSRHLGLRTGMTVRESIDENLYRLRNAAFGADVVCWF